MLKNLGNYFVLSLAAITLSFTFSQSSLVSGMVTVGSVFINISLFFMARGNPRIIGITPAIITVVAAISVIPSRISHPTIPVGGMFGVNYNVLSGVILLGLALYEGPYRWILIALGFASLIVAAAPEGIFVMAVVGLVAMLRRDWGRDVRRIASITFVAAVIIFMLFSSAYGFTVYSATSNPSILRWDTKINTPRIESPLQARWNVIKRELRDIKTLGYGYSPFVQKYVADGEEHILIHNVPLVMVQQMGYPGIVVAILWLGLSIYAMLYSKRYYAWTTMFALGVFDNYTWVFLGFYWWMLLGVSLGKPLQSDMLTERLERL